MTAHKNSIRSYYQNLSNGVQKSMKQRVLSFLVETEGAYTRMQLVEILDIRESSLCGTLKALEMDVLIEVSGTVQSEHGHANNLYKAILKEKEPSQG
jgi:predicted ArsR family transcriptional regulator